MNLQKMTGVVLERKVIEITRVIFVRLLEDFPYFGMNFGSEFISRLPLGTAIQLSNITGI